MAIASVVILSIVSIYLLACFMAAATMLYPGIATRGYEEKIEAVGEAYWDERDEYWEAEKPRDDTKSLKGTS